MKERTMFMFIFFLYIFGSIRLLAKTCPIDTLEGPDKKCYGFFPYGFFHNESEHLCTDFYGGNLASIHNEETNEFIKNNSVFFFDSDDFWIGGKIGENGEGWLWSDKSSFDYRNFYKGRRPSSKSYFGLAFNKNTGKWHGIKNETVLPYVCTI